MMIILLELINKINRFTMMKIQKWFTKHFPTMVALTEFVH